MNKPITTNMNGLIFPVCRNMGQIMATMISRMMVVVKMKVLTTA